VSSFEWYGSGPGRVLHPWERRGDLEEFSIRGREEEIIHAEPVCPVAEIQEQ
jgi:hypothetical protein